MRPNIVAVSFLLLLANAVYAGFSFTTNNGALALIKYTGGGVANIPSETNGMPVTAIGTAAFEDSGIIGVTIPNSIASLGTSAFQGCVGLSRISIPDSVTNVGGSVFGYCASLTNVTIGSGITRLGGSTFSQCYGLTAVYFRGNAPSFGTAEFYQDNNPTLYYLPQTTGWSSNLGGLSAVLWDPHIQASNIDFWAQSNKFGFNITGSTNLLVIVETCSNLFKPDWTPAGTNVLSTIAGTNGTSYFNDPQWTNYSARFYRFRSP